MQMVVVITTGKQKEAGKHSPHSPVPLDTKKQFHMKTGRGLGFTPTNFVIFIVAYPLRHSIEVIYFVPGIHHSQQSTMLPFKLLCSANPELPTILACHDVN